MHEAKTKHVRIGDSKMLRESGVHKLVIADRDGNCIAYLLAWDHFEYDAETDTHVCVAERDGQELITIHTKGEIKPEPGTDRYVVTAPAANGCDRDLADANADLPGANPRIELR